MHDDPVWLMYFMKGTVKAPTDEAAGKKNMEGHFANMKKQASLGRLFAAGPLKDPAEQRRGITVVQAHNRKAVDSYFTQDPFVKAGIMTIDAVEWKVSTNNFNPAVNPSSIIEHRLILITRGMGMSPESPAMRAEHESVMKSLDKMPGSVWGYAGGTNGILEAAIISGADDAAIKKKLDSDPLIKKAILAYEILPLWMSKGVVRD